MACPKDASEEIESLVVPLEIDAGASWIDLLVDCKIANSKSEVRRLIQQEGFYIERERVGSISAR